MIDANASPSKILSTYFGQTTLSYTQSCWMVKSCMAIISDFWPVISDKHDLFDQNICNLKQNYLY